MKILSLKQPWAHAIVSPLAKRIENRTWRTTHRGPFLLHASKGCSSAYLAWSLEWMRAAGVLVGELARDALPMGGIVGIARVVDVLEPGSLGATTARDVDLRWWMRDQFGFVLADVRPLPFIPCRGSLNFFHAPPDVLARVPPDVLAAYACDDEAGR